MSRAITKVATTVCIRTGSHPGKSAAWMHADPRSLRRFFGRFVAESLYILRSRCFLEAVQSSPSAGLTNPMDLRASRSPLGSSSPVSCTSK